MDPMFVRVAMSNPPRSVKMNNFIIIIWDDNNNVISSRAYLVNKINNKYEISKNYINKNNLQYYNYLNYDVN